MLDYAADGRCHNSEPGWYGQECGKTATWLSTKVDTGFSSGFCDDCKVNGWERHGRTWQRMAAGWVAEYQSSAGTLCYGYGEKPEDAWQRVREQFAGVSARTRAGFMSRTKLRALGPDEASAIAEMIAADAIGWLDHR